jgi:hypothetical protein
MKGKWGLAFVGALASIVEFASLAFADFVLLGDTFPKSGTYRNAFAAKGLTALPDRQPKFGAPLN